MEHGFDLEKLIVDVFAPQSGEKVLVMTDLPHGELSDHDRWRERRKMAEEWRSAFERLGARQGFRVLPLLTYPATGANNADLPAGGEMAGQKVRFEEVFSDTNIVVALTEYSASAPLIKYSQKLPGLRAASMPKVTRSMENTALSADYSEVARKAHILADKLDRTDGVRVQFSTAHKVYFDLRNRTADADDGLLHVDKTGMRLINLPSGEACIAPYEGEVEGQPSRTEGTIPVMDGEELVLFEVRENRIERVIGDGPEAARRREYFAVDGARRNLAELGLGCNDKAVISGIVLEDEKVLGMHWAYGRSDHIGGITGVQQFSDPSHVVHQDIVYAKGGPVDVASLVLEYEDGSSEELIKDAEYTIF
jgi:leucyl aminopeptidase (aminopeptidase T)